MNKTATRKQVSAGGVPFRQVGDRIEIVLISVGEEGRWQLPKGLVDRQENPEDAALREVEEETGLQTDMVGPLDTIEYWYYSTTSRGRKVRFHKYVHYYLLRYTSGSTADYDKNEVNEARWFEIGDALQHLAFDNEKAIVRLARTNIKKLS